MKKILLFIYCACCISYAAFSQLPVAGIILGNQRLCPGTCTDYLNASTNATSYQWTFAGATPSTSTDVNPVNICYNAPGIYDVTLIATNSFGSDTLLLSNYLTVYPYPPPLGFMQSGDTLTANQGFVSYQWYLNGNQIAGATNYIYIGNVSGEYAVVGTDSNGCEVETAIFGIIWLGIKKITNEIEVVLFPNPAREMLFVHSNSFIGAAGLKIFNTLGELVLAVPPLAFGERAAGEADVSQLPTGIYWVEISVNEKISRNKFVKQ